MVFNPDEFMAKAGIQILPADKPVNKPFDPDKFLKAKGISLKKPDFNPDEFLKKKGIQPAAEYKPPKEPTIGSPSGRPATEALISAGEEIAFATERLLKPALEQAPKQPENLRVISADAFRAIGAPAPEFLADLTDPNTWGVGMALSPLLNPVLKASFKAAGKMVSAAAQPVIKWFENKIAERKARQAISEMLSPKVVPQKIVSLGEARGDVPQAVTPLKFPKPPSKIVSLGEARGDVPLDPKIILNTQPLPQSLIPVEKLSYLSRLDDMIEWSPSKRTLEPSGEFNSKALRLKTELIDKYAPVYALVKKIEQVTGKVIPFDEDPYTAVRLYAGVAGKAEPILEQMREILKPVRFQTKNLEYFMLGHRAIERAERGIANPADVTAWEAKKGIQELRQKLSPKMMQAVEDADYWIREKISFPLLDRLEKSGIISGNDKSRMIAKGESWAPFDMVEYLSDTEAGVALGRKSISMGSQDIVKYLTGARAGQKVRPALDSLVSRIYKTVEFSDRNMVIRKIAHLRNLSAQAEELVLDKIDKLPAGYKAVSYYEDGVRRGIGLPAAVADSLTGMNQHAFDFMTRFAGLGTQALRLGATTLNIPFAVITNPIRDFQTVGVTSGRGWGVFPSWVKGFFSAIQKDGLYNEFMAAGGGQSGFLTHMQGAVPSGAVTESGLIRFAKTITNPVELITYIGGKLELAPRLAAMDIALKRGLSKEQAAFMARESTVDFSRSGSWGRLANMWVPFLNARFQGSLILGKAIKDKPMASAFNIGTMTALPAYATYVHNRRYFSALYDEIPTHEKENYFIWILGSQKDENTGTDVPRYVAIPKGDIGRIFGNPIELAGEWAWQNKKLDVFQAGLQMLSDVSPVEFEYEGKISPSRAVGSVLPPVIKGIVETFTGKSFYFQNEIIPTWLRDVKTKSLQYTQRTPRTLVWLGEKTNTSPMLWENFLRNTFGPGIFQVLEPQKIPATLRDRIIHVKGGAKTEDIYKFNEELRGEKADLRVQMQHAVTDILTGGPNQQEAAKRVMEKVLLQVPAADRKDFFRYQVNASLDRQLPPEYQAFKRLSVKDRKQYIIREKK